MKSILLKVVAAIALLIGLMAVITGTRVLTGYLIPDYNVLPLLVYYNVFMGFASIFTGILIWIKYSKALAFTVGIAVGHISVLLSLLTLFNSVVADQSIKAMIFRSIIWIVIFIILRKTKK